jgi:hypothetical protein
VGKGKDVTVYRITPNVLHRIRLKVEVSVMWQKRGLTAGNIAHQDTNSNPFVPLSIEKRSSGVSRKEYIAECHAEQSLLT